MKLEARVRSVPMHRFPVLEGSALAIKAQDPSAPVFLEPVVGANGKPAMQCVVLAPAIIRETVIDGVVVKSRAHHTRSDWGNQWKDHGVWEDHEWTHAMAAKDPKGAVAFYGHFIDGEVMTAAEHKSLFQPWGFMPGTSCTREEYLREKAKREGYTEITVAKFEQAV